jgi:hypothetical protein
VINLIYITALILTLIVELAVAVLFGYKSKRELTGIAAVSLVTNPILNFIFLSNNYFAFLIVNVWSILIMESAIVLIEWLMLRYALNDKPIRLLLMSIAMNSCSYLAGLLLLGSFK